MVRCVDATGTRLACSTAPQAALLVIEFPVIVKVHATTRLDGRGGGRPTSKGIVAEGATDCTRSAMIPSPFMLAVSRCRTRENPHRPGRARWSKLSTPELSANRQ